MLSSGELATRCHVSLRTVQFYDQKGLLQPTKLSESGKRLYDEKAIEKLETICLYRNFGFSLKEISTLLLENKEDFIKKIMEKQRQMKQEEKTRIDLQLFYMTVFLEASKHNDFAKNMEELNLQICESKQYKKDTFMMYGFLCLFVLLTGLLGILFSIFHASYLIYSIVVLIALSLLIYYHSKTQAYVCPKCHMYFEIGFFQDLFSLNNGSKGKVLKCPVCKRRGSFKETYHKRRKAIQKELKKR